MESLAVVGHAIMQRFKALQSVETLSYANGKSHEWPKDLFLTQFDKFELWTVNLGVFVIGHGSLDYRIRDAESMKEAIYQMMKSLNRSLDEVLDYANGNIEEGDEDSDTDSEMGSDIDLLLDTIKDPIDRLYKLAVWTRNPATRLPSSKARHFQQIDEKSNVDLFKSFNAFDYDYVRSVFGEYEKRKAASAGTDHYLKGATTDEVRPDFDFLDHLHANNLITRSQFLHAISFHEAPQPKNGINSTPHHRPLRDKAHGGKAISDEGRFASEDKSWELSRETSEPNKDNASNGVSYLVGRIARANGRRRQQFAYWKKYRDKLREHLSAVLEPSTSNLSISIPTIDAMSKGLKPSISATAATEPRLSQSVGERILETDNVRDESVSESTPSTQHLSKDIINFPPPPKVPITDNIFECPYCFTLCPVSFLSEKAWRAHVIRDLRPYVCTYEHCSTSEQLYDSRDDWIRHEISTHQGTFRCFNHDANFTTLEAYQQHTQIYHKADQDPSYFATPTMSNIHQRCPVCSMKLESAQQLQSHVGVHLVRLAMFSLPRSTDDYDDDDDDDDEKRLESQSASVQLDVGQFFAEDLDKDSTFSSEAKAAYEKSEEMRNTDLVAARMRTCIETAKSYRQSDEIEKAKSLLQSCAKEIRILGPQDGIFDLLFSLGETCLEMGLIEEAIEAFDHLRFLQNGQLGVNDPALLKTEQKLALAFQINEQFEETNTPLQHVKTAQEKTPMEDSSDIAKTPHYLSATHESRSELQETISNKDTTTSESNRVLFAQASSHTVTENISQFLRDYEARRQERSTTQRSHSYNHFDHLSGVETEQLYPTSGNSAVNRNSSGVSSASDSSTTAGSASRISRTARISSRNSNSTAGTTRK
ncbi:hypothetical protein V8C37DRAFT_405904 [Trichoderma ceciliae]